jgi:hypothetical protein
MPVELKAQMGEAHRAGFRISSSHSPQLSRPAELAVLLEKTVSD